MNPPSRKRKLPDDVITDPVKESILQNEVAKLELLNSIDSKIEALAGNINSKVDRIADQLELMVSNQKKFDFPDVQ